jgi:hypothetical protein
MRGTSKLNAGMLIAAILAGASNRATARNMTKVVMKDCLAIFIPLEGPIRLLRN